MSLFSNVVNTAIAKWTGHIDNKNGTVSLSNPYKTFFSRKRKRIASRFIEKVEKYLQA